MFYFMGLIGTTMVKISDSLQLLFEAPVEQDGDRYIVSIPDELVDDGRLSIEDAYRVALLETTAPEAESQSTSKAHSASASASDAGTPTDVKSQASGEGSHSPSKPTSSSSSGSNRSPGRLQQPPVEEGEVRSVTIDTLGDQGDGIARVGPGFIVIVPGTQPGDQLDVQITNVTETVAFADPVSEPTVR